MRATFGAGCFWGVEAKFRQLPGVLNTVVGFMGGHLDNPTYKQVCQGDSGHAEVVEIEYDPDQISYSELLRTFWQIHNPTEVNCQGPDIGPQYRSVIFFHSDEQQTEAKAQRDELIAGGLPVATSIEAASDFWRAEEYHQNYLEKQRGFHL